MMGMPPPPRGASGSGGAPGTGTNRGGGSSGGGRMPPPPVRNYGKLFISVASGDGWVNLDLSCHIEV